MKLFNFDEALADCEKLMSTIEGYPEDKRVHESYTELYTKTQIQKAMVLTWKGYIAQSIKMFEEIISEKTTSEEIRTQLTKNLEGLKTRQESLKLKVTDLHF